MNVNDEVEQAFREGYDSAKPKESNWVYSDYSGEYFCEYCGGAASLAHNHKHIVTTAYCPHCGSKMVGRI